ncbi:unnamed protein product, partial [Heterosigma akashiwo]
LQKKFVYQLGSVFQHKLSPANRFVGYDLERERAAKTIKVTAASKIAHVLEAHGLGEVRPKYTPCAQGVHLSSDSSGKQVDIDTYQSLVGAFQFIREFRPDISFAVGKLSKFLVSLNLDHMDAALYLAGYLRRTASKGMVFGSARDYAVRVVSDSDHGNCPATGRSTSGMAVFV